MIEELKIISTIFSTATDTALYAYLGFLVFELAKISLIVFPVLSGIKFLVNRMFKNENK